MIDHSLAPRPPFVFYYIHTSGRRRGRRGRGRVGTLHHGQEPGALELGEDDVEVGGREARAVLQLRQGELRAVVV